MRNLSLYISSLIAIALVLMVMFDYLYTAAFENSNPRNKVQLAATLHNRNVDYIFLGSSRVENHIDCDLVEELTGKSCINLGLQGSKINDAKAISILLEANKVTYEKLLLQVDYIYNFNNYSPSLVATIIPFTSRENFSKALKDDLDLPLAYNIPFLRYASNDKLIGIREVILQYAEKKPKVDLSNGFNPLEGIGIEISGDFPNEIATNNAELNEMLATVDNLVLFTAPYCKNTSNRDNYMDALTKRFPNLKNYISIFDEKEQYFSNCGHLNAKGAQEFTEILTRDILLD